METALADYIELETKYKKIYTDHESLEAELKNKDKEIAFHKERGKQLEEELAEVKKSLEEHKINLSSEIKSREDLKAQLLLCQKECVDKIKKEAEAKSKVNYFNNRDIKNCTYCVLKM